MAVMTRGEGSTQPTEVVVQLSPDKVPFKNTTTGKTIRTFLQTTAGIVAIFVLSDDFRHYVTNSYPALALYIPLLTAFFTALQNGIDPNVKNF